MLGIPAYLLSYLCLLITVKVTYERTLQVAYVCKVTGHLNRVPRLPDVGTPGDQVTTGSCPLQVRVHPTKFKEKGSEDEDLLPENKALLHITRATVSLDIAGHSPCLFPHWVWRDFCFQPFFT